MNNVILAILGFFLYFYLFYTLWTSAYFETSPKRQENDCSCAEGSVILCVNVWRAAVILILSFSSWGFLPLIKLGNHGHNIFSFY